MKHEGDTHVAQSWSQQAEAACLVAGLPLTASRKQILKLIADAPVSFSAYAIIRSMSQLQKKPVGPPTVYRMLDFLVLQGFLHRIESRNAFTRCDHPTDRHDSIFLICERCDRAEEIVTPQVETALQDATIQAGFAPHRHVIEIEGLCADCVRESKTCV